VTLWNNDGQVAEGAMVGIQVTLRRDGRNGGPGSPIDPAPLEAGLAELVAGEAELRCWVDEGGVYWHAELLWTAGVQWGPADAASADALAGDVAAFCSWAERVAAWLGSRPVPGLPPTTAVINAEYGRSWAVPLPAGKGRHRKQRRE
jgi:hypothetical protein